jgi:hypothetical protein
MSRAAGAMRIELMARQLWADALWGVDLRDDARREARVVSREAGRRSLRQIASMVELQCACWAAEEGDWPLVATHRQASERWGASNGAVSERAFAAALDLLLALSRDDHVSAIEAFDRIQCQAPGYQEPTFVDLLHRAAAMAHPEFAARLCARAAPNPC